jgi:hypothetical protein
MPALFCEPALIALGEPRLVRDSAEINAYLDELRAGTQSGYQTGLGLVGYRYGL